MRYQERYEQGETWGSLLMEAEEELARLREENKQLRRAYESDAEAIEQAAENAKLREIQKQDMLGVLELRAESARLREDHAGTQAELQREREQHCETLNERDRLRKNYDEMRQAHDSDCREARRLREALREIYSVAALRLNEQSPNLADNDYAAFDHIAGIARRNALNEETI